MEKKEINIERLVKYWIRSSDDDFAAMNAMFKNKMYNWSLFVGHLMIERLLKALYVKVMKDYPPMTHNLLRLIEKCDVELEDSRKEFFVTVTAFNINARYDDYKMSFQKKCTEKFTSEWIKKLKANRKWIKELISQ